MYPLGSICLYVFNKFHIYPFDSICIHFPLTCFHLVLYVSIYFPMYPKSDYITFWILIFRVYNDSLLKYSARVNYDVACPMHFEKYPVDIQRCNISFESWGHTNHYIVLSWLSEKRKFSSSIALAQFDLDLHFIEEPPSAFGTLGKTRFYWILRILMIL